MKELMNSEKNLRWLEWARELELIAQVGLLYCTDAFDRERYERIRGIADEMTAEHTGLPEEKIRDLFSGETGYPTPKLDTRAAIFRDGKILLVHEKNGTWSLPGGWVDANLSVGANVVKEVREEAGLSVTPELIIAVQDRERHNLPLYPYKVCKIFVLCRDTGADHAFSENAETTERGYFSLDELPLLAEEKNNAAQITLCFEAAQAKNWTTILE